MFNLKNSLWASRADKTLELRDKFTAALGVGAFGEVRSTPRGATTQIGEWTVILCNDSWSLQRSSWSAPRHVDCQTLREITSGRIDVDSLIPA